MFNSVCSFLLAEILRETQNCTSLIERLMSPRRSETLKFFDQTYENREITSFLITLFYIASK
jgi:hypothetical protein